MIGAEQGLSDASNKASNKKGPDAILYDRGFLRSFFDVFFVAFLFYINSFI